MIKSYSTSRVGYPTLEGISLLCFYEVDGYSINVNL
nr:MAG TPA: hypothetical protein [Caudoviricetes sp.]DAV08100.1 MAG TPA: hypothetical protein [Caudoviricetes sp.]